MFKQNKFSIIFPVVITIFILICSIAFAEGNKIGIVTGDNLNVRQSPDLSANILTKLSKGTTVNVISDSGDWYNINYNEVNGWVFSKYLDIKDRSFETGTINGDSVNVRKEPNLTSSKIAKLNKGEQVDVYEKSGDWYKVKLTDGKNGWVFSQYIIVRDTLASRGSSGRETNSEEPLDKPEPETNIRTKLIDYAKKFLGVKYVYGKSSPSGFDCSGFTQYVFKHFNIKLERSAKNQSKHGVKVSKNNLKTGDLVFFDTNGGLNDIRHVGIYIGNGKFIHASSGKSTGKVVISDMNSGFYAKSYMTARRYIK